MGLGSVIATFVMCIIFNILLPSGDQFSDINLMYKTMTFDLGNSIELEGCKSCYHKTEKEVYFPEKELLSNSCKSCFYNPKLLCGMDLPLVRLRRAYEGNKESCSDDESFRRINYFDLEKGECSEANDLCCLTRTKEVKRENPKQFLDPKKVFYPCESLTKELDYCLVSAKASVMNCASIYKDVATYQELFYKRRIRAESASENGNIFFYPYFRSNKSWIMEDSNHSITDPNIQCGLLFYRHNSNENSKDPRHNTLTNEHYCLEDSCLTHLKALHFLTSITDLEEWRKKTDYYASEKVGGLTCHLLQIYGASISIPLLLNLFFNIIIFVHDFEKKGVNIFEIIPLILLIYPQYKTMKFLAKYLFIHRNEDLLNKDKEVHNRDVASLEPFLESCLQVKNTFFIFSTI